MILNQYLGMRFLFHSLAVLFGFTSTAFLALGMDLLRRYPDVLNITDAFSMALLQLPFFIDYILPLIFLVGVHSATLGFQKTLALDVMRASGLSLPGFLAPAFGLALILGIIDVVWLSDVSAKLLSRAQHREATLQLGIDSSLISAPLWSQQPLADGWYLFHAGSSFDDGRRARDVQFFNFDRDDRLLNVVSAEAAQRENGVWKMRDSATYTSGSPTEVRPVHEIPFLSNTTSRHSGIGFFSPPGFWNTLNQLAASGWRTQWLPSSVAPNFHSHLARPLAFFAAALLGGAMALRDNTRHPKMFRSFSKIAIVGLIFLFITKIFHDLGRASLILPAASGWIPALLLLGVGVWLTRNRSQ